MDGVLSLCFAFWDGCLYRKEQSHTVGDKIADNNENNGADESENALAEVLSL